MSFAFTNLSLLLTLDSALICDKPSSILETFLRNLVPRFAMFFILCEAASLQFVRQLSL